MKKMIQTFIWSIDDVVRKLWRALHWLLGRFMTYGHSGGMRSAPSSGVSAKSINFDYATDADGGEWIGWIGRIGRRLRRRQRIALRLAGPVSTIIWFANLENHQLIDDTGCGDKGRLWVVGVWANSERNGRK